jgi:RNA polymerase sigma-70 factor (ECF subfamily)
MPDHVTDEQLLAEFLGGRREALGALAERYERPLLGLACSLLGGAEAPARDAVQNTWLRIIKYGSGFKRKCTFKTWVYRITINECRRLHAKQGNERAARPIPKDCPGGESPDAPTMQAERNHVLHEALDRLNQRKRLVLLLCYHEGMPHVQAAQILGIPTGTLKSRLNAALGELRRALPAEVTS